MGMDDSEIYRMKELPEGLSLPGNFFDLVEMYHLNGPPASIEVYAKMIHKHSEEDAFLANAQRVMSDPHSVKPIIEFYIVCNWDDADNYAFRLPEVIAYGMAKGIALYFDQSPALELYADTLAEVLYGEGATSPTPVHVPSKEI